MDRPTCAGLAPAIQIRSAGLAEAELLWQLRRRAVESLLGQPNTALQIAAWRNWIGAEESGS
jgi:hypothetical protein